MFRRRCTRLVLRRMRGILVRLSMPLISAVLVSALGIPAIIPGRRSKRPESLIRTGSARSISHLRATRLARRHRWRMIFAASSSRRDGRVSAEIAGARRRRNCRTAVIHAGEILPILHG